MTYIDFIRPELSILIPVLYFFGCAIRKSNISNRWIPLILGGTAVFLSTLWVFSCNSITNIHDLFTGLFTAFTQGVLLAGVSVYADQIYKQSKK